MLKRLISFLCTVVFALILLPQNQTINEAIKHIGEPYHYTEAGPHVFDCSGFTFYIFKEVHDIQLQRTAKKQGYDDLYIQVNKIRPGDLLSFNTNHCDSDLSDHMGIAISDTLFIHCSSAAHKVKISSYTEGWYAQKLSWARRVVYKREELQDGECNDQTRFTR